MNSYFASFPNIVIISNQLTQTNVKATKFTNPFPFIGICAVQAAYNLDAPDDTKPNRNTHTHIHTSYTNAHIVSTMPYLIKPMHICNIDSTESM